MIVLSVEFPNEIRKFSPIKYKIWPVWPVELKFMEITMERKKITISDLMARKAQGRKITSLTAYDYPTAQIVD